MPIFIPFQRCTMKSAMLLLVLYLSGCATGPAENRIDNIPMYGQPGIPRPDAFKKADEDFIKQATSTLGVSREAASTAWYTEANEFIKKGNLDYAMRRYNQSWLLNPDNYQPYWGFGRVMSQRGKREEAIQYLEKAIELCKYPYQMVALVSDTGSIYSQTASLLENTQAEKRSLYFQRANKLFMRSTELDPNYATAWEQWAHSLFREEKYSESWAKIKKARFLGATETEIFVGNLEKRMPEPK